MKWIIVIWLTIIYFNAYPQQQKDGQLRDSNKVYYGRITGKNPYMTANPTVDVGHITYLKKGIKVELIDLVNNMLKINYGNQVGFVYPTFFEYDSDYKNFYEPRKIQQEKEQSEKELKAQEQINHIEEQFDSLKNINTDSSFLVVRPKKTLNVKLYVKPSESDKYLIREIAYNDLVKFNQVSPDVQDYRFINVVGLLNHFNGYLLKDDLETTPELENHIVMLQKKRNTDVYTKFKKEQTIEDDKRAKQLAISKENNAKQAAIIQEKQRKANENRKANLTVLFGEQVAQRIMNKEYWIGMTSAQAIESLGSPKTNNESVSSWGRKEQWVYNGFNLYFENGVMTSYQKSH